MSRSEPESRTTPLVTVVTVTLNAGPALQATMDSVLGQTYPRIESIVIDGGSADGSVALLEARSDRLAAWVSEPDRGIYDAMNKGITLARGEWIIFMNAGDRFAAPDAVEAMMRSAAGQCRLSVWRCRIAGSPWYEDRAGASAGRDVAAHFLFASGPVRKGRRS